MSQSGQPASAAVDERRPPGTPLRGFQTLAVARVVPETPDAVSLVLDVPGELRESFRYTPGQFCTFRVTVDGEPLMRSYSMSSAPEVDDHLKVTVKRVPGGAVSNWINDNVTEGDRIEATAPAGVFCLPGASPDRPGTAADVVAFAAGSGITPVMSILKSALASGTGTVRLLYANRDTESVIFRTELEELADRHPGRLEVVHHLDVDSGFVDDTAVGAFVGEGLPANTEVFVCGPTPFMDVVEDALGSRAVDPSRIHIERFTAAHEVDDPVDWAEAAPDDDRAGDEEEGAHQDRAGGDPGQITLTIELDGRTATAEHRPGSTILQEARGAGLNPPFSCEAGHCATCMAMVEEGTVEMHVNDALTEDEVAQGWILTCQSVPTSASVRVRYGYD